MPDLVLQLRPGSDRAAVLDDLLSWADLGYQDAVDQAIVMLADLHRQGQASSYAKKLQALPIWELKSHARGGRKGGVRVYFFFRPTGEIAVAGAEVKDGSRPGLCLTEALRFWQADSREENNT
jgi:hypothetical protein